MKGVEALPDDQVAVGRHGQAFRLGLFVMDQDVGGKGGGRAEQQRREGGGSDADHGVSPVVYVAESLAMAGGAVTAAGRLKFEGFRLSLSQAFGA